MPLALAGYKQIHFQPIDGQTGTFELVINRPGYPDLVQAAADTLRLTGSAVTDYSSPFIESGGEFQFSKKFTTSVGRRAVDDVSILIRDAISYTGLVNGVTVSEGSSVFLAAFQTFFDIWFGNPADPNNTAPYKAFLLYTDFAAGTPGTPTDIYIGWIDPTYNPISDPYVIAPGTANQIMLGTRTVKVTALNSAQLAITWGNVLAAYNATNNPNVPPSYTGITASDCKEGDFYCGFMQTQDGYATGKSNSRADPFSSSAGSYYQAVPYIHKYNGDPVFVALPAAKWPLVPFVAPTNGSIATLGSFFDPGTNPGTGYAVGDTGTIGAGSATYKIDFVSGGAVVLLHLTGGGSGFSTGLYGTATGGSQPGSGTGMILNITKVISGSLFGPSGSVGISVGTLFAKIAEAMGLSTFTPSTDLKSALDFFIQTNGASNFSFPLITTAKPLDELYVSLNLFAKCHPYDGSYWDNPVGFSPDTAISEVIKGLADFLLSDFNEVFVTAGTSKLQLTPMGATSGGIPAAWQFMGTAQTETPSQGPTNAVVNNRGDGLKIQCPISDRGQGSSIEIPIRFHRIGNTGGASSGAQSLDAESLSFLDTGNYPGGIAQEYFRVAWLDSNGVPTVNPNCWKGLCYLYWFDSTGTNTVYPGTWNPFPNNDGSAGSWANAFYVVSACYKSGSTPPGDLQAQVQGNDYFNSRDYHSVAFAALTLLRNTVQTFQYSGIADATGSLQVITSGLAGQWRLADNATQDWRAIQVDQLGVAGNSTIKFQAIGTSGAFPNLTDLTYGVVGGSGGTSSTTGGNTVTGGLPNGNNPTSVWSTTTASLTGATNNLSVALTTPNVYLRLSATGADTLTGIVPVPNCVFLVITNTGTNQITIAHQDSASAAANRFILNFGGPLLLMQDATYTFFYDSTAQRWRQQ